MGLLDRTNPRATRESVIRWAIGGAIGTPVYVVLRLPHLPHRFWPLILIAAAVLGAGLGALMEWQLDDSEEEDKAAEAVPPAGVWDRELDHEY